ncbi:MAG: hypothetical protein ACXIUZ_03145 [Lysobacteraceae bacterium]
MSTQRETLQQKARIFALLVVAIFGGGAAFAAISDWLQWSDVVVLTGFSVALLGWIVPWTGAGHCAPPPPGMKPIRPDTTAHQPGSSFQRMSMRGSPTSFAWI